MDYINALLADLEFDLPRVWGRNIVSIFIGGGTPSLFSPEAIDTLLSGLRARIGLKPEAEITLEANPNSADVDRFQGYRETGINRLSVGIQSFDNDLLEQIGRNHNGRQAFRAVEAAHKAGFTNLNLDLMYGLPQQDVAAAVSDIRNAVDLEPTHISHYQLTIEANTRFHTQPPGLPDDDDRWAMEAECQQQLKQHGFEHYEVSAYARAGHGCQHNLNYWQFGDYLGIGAGAHAKLSHPNKGIVRLMKTRHPQHYLDRAGTADGVQTETRPAAVDTGFEFMLNALRLTTGFDESLFQERTGLDLGQLSSTLAEAAERGWITHDAGMIRPTAEGRRWLNNLLELFLPAD